MGSGLFSAGSLRLNKISLCQCSCLRFNSTFPYRYSPIRFGKSYPPLTQSFPGFSISFAAACSPSGLCLIRTLYLIGLCTTQSVLRVSPNCKQTFSLSKPSQIVSRPSPIKAFCLIAICTTQSVTKVSANRFP